MKRLEKFPYSFVTLIFAFGSGLAAVLITMWAFRENPFNLFNNKIPLSADGLLIATFLKIILKHSLTDIWIGQISDTQLGWPAQINFNFFPFGNLIDVSLIKIFSQISNITDPYKLIHIFSIVKSFGIGFLSFFVIKIFARKNHISAFFAIIFATNSYNLIRAEGHFFLSLTWVVPIAILFLYLNYNEIYVDSKRIFHPKLFFLGLFIGLENYYYSFFTLVLLFLIWSLGLYLTYSKKLAFIDSVSNLIKKSITFINSLIGLVFGILIQIAPSIYNQNNSLHLTSVADRSPTESYIFSGNLESLFSEPVKFVLTRLKRYDLINYINSQIQWESTQVGIVSSIFLLYLIIYFIFSFLKNFKYRNRPINTTQYSKETIDNNLFFLSLLLVFSLVLYFRSPINFGISRVVPQIRAWGRIEIFISLLTLIILAVLISNSSLKIKSTSLILILSIQLLDMNDFRLSRLPSATLNQIANEQINQNDLTLKYLSKKYKPSCSIAQLPVYPFPEFDTPNDSNIDYGMLTLPLQTNNFKWSYGGFKSTSDFSMYQQLISEFPNFSRASLNYQISYVQNLNPCAIILDKSYLTPNETKNLANLNESKFSFDCIIDLPGSKFLDNSRYSIIDISSSKCDSLLSSIRKQSMFRKFDKTNSFIYRIDSPYSIGYHENFEMFTTSSNIDTRFMSKNLNKLNLMVKIDEKSVLSNEIPQICYSIDGKKFKCILLIKINSGFYSASISNRFKDNKLYKVQFSMRNIKVSTENSWGLILRAER